MKVYFFSFVKCALKVNGVFLGQVHTETIAYDVNKGDYLEFISPDHLPLCCVLGNHTPLISQVEKENFYLVFPHGFTHYPFEFEKNYSQNFFADTVNVTVFCDSGCKILLQSQSDFAIFPFPFYPRYVESFCADNRIIALFLNKKTVLVFNVENKIRKLFEFSASEFIANKNTLLCKRFPPTILKHEITYTISNKMQLETSVRRTLPTDLPEDLKKLAFLECLAVGDGVEDFLCMSADKEKLCEFLGDYIAVLPPPDDKYDYTLLYRNDVKFISLKTSNFLISDIILD